jgi:hypothetical protein
VKFETAKLPPRVLLAGEPATGKTAGIASLANAGFRILLFDMDQNARVIGNYLKPGHADIHIKTFEVAEISNTNIFASGPKDATIKAVAELKKFTQMLEHWKDGDEDLGPSANLTANDVVVIDSGTFMGDLLLLAAHEDPKTKKDMRSLYMVAGEYYAAILDYLCGKRMGASVLFLTHIMQTGEKDDQGKFIGKPRDIPVAVGEKASKRMQTYFSDIWYLEVDRAGNRVVQTAATSTVARRTSAPDRIKAVEPYDLGSLFKRLTE